MRGMVPLADPPARALFADRRRRAALYVINLVEDGDVAHGFAAYAVAYTEARNWWETAGCPAGQLDAFIDREVVASPAASSWMAARDDNGDPHLAAGLRLLCDRAWPTILGQAPVPEGPVGPPCPAEDVADMREDWAAYAGIDPGGS